MKTANVISIRVLSPEGSGAATTDESGDDAALAAFLRRYPHIDEVGRGQLLRFVKKATPPRIRAAFLSRGLEPRLTAFRKDHADELCRGWAAWTPFILGVMLLTTLLGLFT